MLSPEVKSITQIEIPFPDSDNRQLYLSIGACRLRIKPGGGAMWVRGTYDDPTENVPIRLTQSGGTVRISQEFRFEAFGQWTQPPLFDLELGAQKPFALVLETGASECELDLGGLPITQLTLKHGAGKVTIDFSAPNPETLGFIVVGSGASGTELRNLANANFSEMRIEGGAAGYILDFGGTLRQNGHVQIETGLANVELLIPSSTCAQVKLQPVLGSVEAGAEFTEKEGALWNGPALTGVTPGLTIQGDVTLGSVQVRTTNPSTQERTVNAR